MIYDLYLETELPCGWWIAVQVGLINNEVTFIVDLEERRRYLKAIIRQWPSGIAIDL